MRSGNESNANKAYIFSSVGSLDGDSTDRRHAVRPALHSTAVNFFLIKPRIFRAFGTIVRSYDAWLRSGDWKTTSLTRTLGPAGGHDYSYSNLRRAVRPALQLNCGKFFLIKPRKSALLGLSFTSDAWLRSGNHNNANNANSLTASGGRNNNNTNRYYAVRPALHSSVKNFSADNSRIPFV